MAKLILLILCGLIGMTGNANAAARSENTRFLPIFLQIKPDTLTIEHDIAHQPFLLDTISPEAIKILFGEGWVVKKQPVANRFIKNQTDTLITIKKSKSYICLYAVSKADKSFFQSAEIRDPLPIFQKDLHIGQSKQEIQALFPELKSARPLPDQVKIGAGEAGDFLYLSFQKGRLHKVAFKPYLD